MTRNEEDRSTEPRGKMITGKTRKRWKAEMVTRLLYDKQGKESRNGLLLICTLNRFQANSIKV